ncbi:MAG: MarR family winged helix-turn-helix transcriptional regulator [Bacteroidia bacterium]
MRLENEISQKNFRNDYHKAFVNIIYTNNWLLADQSIIFKPYDITAQQYNILRILRGNLPKPATIKFIRTRMLDKMSDASRIVEKLRMKGLIERNTNDSDRRNVDVMITAKGIDLLKSLDFMDEAYETKLNALNADEVRQLNDLLDKMRG